MALMFPRLKTLVVIFALVLGNSPLVDPAVITLSAATIGKVAAAATQAISAGSSLAGATLQGLADKNYFVTCSIQVENWTRYPLKYPTARVNGALTVAPTAILPSKREAFAVRKTSGSATGVYGTVSWEVGDTHRRFVLMWSAPFDFNLHSNWMGLGMTRSGFTNVAEGNKWFDQMYYGSSDYYLNFERGEFYYTTDPVIYRDNQFEIVGVMTNVHNAQIKVIFRPSRNNWKDLADPIRSLLESNRNPKP